MAVAVDCADVTTRLLALQLCGAGGQLSEKPGTGGAAGSPCLECGFYSDISSGVQEQPDSAFGLRQVTSESLFLLTYLKLLPG
jgi:hypothetical protein